MIKPILLVARSRTAYTVVTSSIVCIALVTLIVSNSVEDLATTILDAYTRITSSYILVTLINETLPVSEAVNAIMASGYSQKVIPVLVAKGNIVDLNLSVGVIATEPWLYMIGALPEPIALIDGRWIDNPQGVLVDASLSNKIQLGHIIKVALGNVTLEFRVSGFVLLGLKEATILVDYAALEETLGSKAPVNHLIVVPRGLDNETLSRLRGYVEDYLRGRGVKYSVIRVETGFENLIKALTTFKASITIIIILSLLLAITATQATIFLHIHTSWSELLLLRVLGFTVFEIVLAYVLQTMISTILGLIVASTLSMVLGDMLVYIITPEVLLEIMRRQGLEIDIGVVKATPYIVIVILINPLASVLVSYTYLKLASRI